MVKKLLDILIIFILLFLSFVYSKKVISLVNKNTPLMNEIVNYSNNYFIEPVDAVINTDEIITGLNGCKIDINDSYLNMNSIFNKKLLIYEQVKPEISSLEMYDKYIVKGNNLENNVSLVFIVGENSNVEKVIDILNDNNVNASFFITSSNNKDDIHLITKNNNEVYNYDYNKTSLKKNNNFYKYCLLKNKDDEILELCKNNLSKTILPNLYIERNYLITVKQNIKNGSIICLLINNNLIFQLDEMIKYIKTKGYNFLKLDNLLNESRNCS